MSSKLARIISSLTGSADVAERESIAEVFENMADMLAEAQSEEDWSKVERAEEMSREAAATFATTP